MTRMTIGFLFAIFCCGSLLAAPPEKAPGNKCPSPGSTVPFAKVMNPAFIADYTGCDVVVEADFYKTGNEGYKLGEYDTSSNATFQALEPGGAPTGALGLFGKFCGISKASSDIIFSLQPGNKIRMRGAPLGYYVGSTLVATVFDAKSVEKIE